MASENATANILGIHALVWAGDTSRASIELAVQQTINTGYQLLELSLHDLDNLDIAHTRETLSTAKCQVACSRGLAPDADVSSEDMAVVRRGAQLLQASLSATAGMGGHLLSGALYSAFGKGQAPISARGRDNAIAVLRELADEAAGRNVRLGLEVCNRYETNVVNTARQVLELADDIGRDNVLIHLDTYHMNIEEDDFRRPVHDVGDRLGYVHIGENHRGFLGSGHIDFASFFHALADIGYAGPITFESFSSAVVAQGLSNDLAVWRNLWSDGVELANHAHAFISGHLAAAAIRADGTD
jgi:D-psicose/D-tagatose/L-ribulose 3-epimerase